MSKRQYADIDPEVVRDWLDFLYDGCGSWYELACDLRTSVKRLLQMREGTVRPTVMFYGRLHAEYVEACDMQAAPDDWYGGW